MMERRLSLLSFGICGSTLILCEAGTVDLCQELVRLEHDSGYLILTTGKLPLPCNWAISPIVNAWNLDFPTCLETLVPLQLGVTVGYPHH